MANGNLQPMVSGNFQPVRIFCQWESLVHGQWESSAHGQWESSASGHWESTAGGKLQPMGIFNQQCENQTFETVKACTVLLLWCDTKGIRGFQAISCCHILMPSSGKDRYIVHVCDQRHWVFVVKNWVFKKIFYWRLGIYDQRLGAFVDKDTTDIYDQN